MMTDEVRAAIRTTCGMHRMLQGVIHEAAATPNLTGVIVHRTYDRSESARRALITAVNVRRGSYDSAQRAYTFSNGSIVRFYTCGDSAWERLRGIEIDLAYADYDVDDRMLEAVYQRLVRAPHRPQAPQGTPAIVPATPPVTIPTGRLFVIASEVVTELARAIAHHAPMHSAHEGYAVILEELDELWAHVKANTASGADARKEAIQIAAMAMRYALDVCGLEEAK